MRRRISLGRCALMIPVNIRGIPSCTSLIPTSQLKRESRSTTATKSVFDGSRTAKSLSWAYPPDSVTTHSIVCGEKSHIRKLVVGGSGGTFFLYTDLKKNREDHEYQISYHESCFFK